MFNFKIEIKQVRLFILKEWNVESDYVSELVSFR